MNNSSIWPSITFLFAFFNLLSWYMKGTTLFSWWWMLLVILVDFILISISLRFQEQMISNDLNRETLKKLKVN